MASRELYHIPSWEKEIHLEQCLGWGYVSSQEGILHVFFLGGKKKGFREMFFFEIYMEI